MDLKILSAQHWLLRFVMEELVDRVHPEFAADLTARFPSYSELNQKLIFMQNDEAT